MNTLESSRLSSLIEALQRRGYATIGPVQRGGAIVYDRIASADELPMGWSENQEKARYRLVRNGRPSYFGFSSGPGSWKSFLFPASLKLFTIKKANGSFDIAEAHNGERQRLAFLGVRPCDCAAIQIQDTVLAHGQTKDVDYTRRRENIFIVAVNCTRAAPTCFCASMGTGPRAEKGFDLALTEVDEGARPCFLVSAGSNEGRELLEELHLPESTGDEEAAAERLLAAASESMTRRVERRDLKQLYQKTEHPRWDAIARRCLTCANCTMVCPTCFCTTVEDVTDLSGMQAERWRVWDSCFTVGFSYIHGGSIRPSPKSRYRQWLTHKFAGWVEQFGTPGCVGCGRCITWCPVGIDVTEELNALFPQQDSPASS